MACIFLPELPPKPGCFPIATSFPPCFVAFSGTFFFAGAFSPCFAPKTRMFLHHHTISSRICGVFRDIFFCGGSFSMIYPQNQDVFPLPLHFLHVLWHFPGHFPQRWQFLHVLRPKPGCFSTTTQFPPCFVAFSGTFSSLAAFSPGNVEFSGIFFLPAGIGRIFAGKNISLTLWGIKQEFCNEDI